MKSIGILNKKKEYWLDNVIACLLTITCLYLYSLRGFEHLLVIFVLYLIVNRTLNRGIMDFSAPTKLYKYAFVFLFAVLFVAIASRIQVNIRDSLYFVLWSLPLPIFLYMHNNGNINSGIRYGLELVIVGGFLLSMHDYFLLEIDRPSGLMYNSALWASCMGFVLPLFIYGSIVAHGIRQRIIRCCVSLLIIVNIYLTASRGIIISVTIAGLCLLLLFIFKKSKKTAIILLLVVCAVLIIAFPYLLKIFSRGYDGDRVMAWKASVDMFLNNPFIGIGLMQWKLIYAANYYVAGEKLPHAHNMYLGFLSTTGIIGFSGLIYFLFGWVKTTMEKYIVGEKYFLAALAGIIIFLIYGFVDDVLVVSLYHKVFWFFVAIYQWDIFAEE